MPDKQEEASAYMGKSVQIYLTNGVKLSGTVTQAKPQSLVLSRGGESQSVFYHAVATISPLNSGLPDD